MDDYSALAQRISVNVGDVRGCLILSRDGLVLGAYPDQDESLAKPAWLRFVALGEPEKSFVEFADQVWAYVRRGPYAAFAVAGAGVRPGILVDQLDQGLLLAEEGRTRRDTLRVPDASSAPSGKPRTSLHPPADKPQPADVISAWSKSAPPAPDGTPSPVASGVKEGGAGPTEGGSPPAERVTPEKAAGGDVPPGDGPAEPHSPPDPGEDPTSGEEPEEPTSVSRKKLQKLAGRDSSGAGKDDPEVDRFLLAKEFSGLLQVDKGDDESSS